MCECRSERRVVAEAAASRPPGETALAAMARELREETGAELADELVSR